jgi:hypothetical protein
MAARAKRIAGGSHEDGANRCDLGGYHALCVGARVWRWWRRGRHGKVTSQLVSQDVPSACFIQGTLDGEDCAATADFHFVLDDGSETETSIIGNGDFKAVICRHPTSDLFDGSTGCPDFDNVLCPQIVSYHVSTDKFCAK